GEPTEKMKEVYNIVLEAQKASLETARAGITGYDLDAAAREYIESNGYGKAFGHSLGHGVGMEIHEFPNASSMQKNTILEENNIVTVEPGIYIPEEFGVRIEDFVVIKHDGCFNMTNAEKKLIIL
ncbi:MAG: M24 family metallopeptidase, partial [Ruminococcus callidus]|nr:M24 family metallopeptidase [Ruminococcus callidus]